MGLCVTLSIKSLSFSMKWLFTILFVLQVISLTLAKKPKRQRSDEWCFNKSFKERFKETNTPGNTVVVKIAHWRYHFVPIRKRYINELVNETTHTLQENVRTEINFEYEPHFDKEIDNVNPRYLTLFYGPDGKDWSVRLAIGLLHQTKSNVTWECSEKSYGILGNTPWVANTTLPFYSKIEHHMKTNTQYRGRESLDISLLNLTMTTSTMRTTKMTTTCLATNLILSVKLFLAIILANILN